MVKGPEAALSDGPVELFHEVVQLVFLPRGSGLLTIIWLFSGKLKFTGLECVLIEAVSDGLNSLWGAFD